MKKNPLILIVLFLLQQKASAQFTDSLTIHAGLIATVASHNYQPLWIVANQYGTIANRGSDVAAHLQLTNRHDFGKEVYLTPDSTIRNFTLRYGFDLYNNNHTKSTFFKEAFVKLAYRNLELRGGRYTETIGEVDPFLSSGSLGVSSNALPIPQIGIRLLKYVNIPLTNGWVQFKGQLSHGWFGDDNFVKNSYLHQKSAYLKFGKKALQFYAGLNHFAQWGGLHPLGQLPNRFKDFLRIVAAKRGNTDDPVYQQGAGAIDVANGVGNHIIIPDFGFILNKAENTFVLYTQNIFDKGRADSANQRDELDALRIFGKDHLAGFKWETTRQGFLKGIVFEWISTKSQGGPIEFLGRDNYYNNSLYATGWQYKNRIIGTPLFINRQDAARYNLDLNKAPTDPRQVISNRIAGIHFGFKGAINPAISYRILATHLHHYGNYYNDAVFLPVKKQNHLLLEASWTTLQTVRVGVALGEDFGDISTNTAGRLSIEWRLF